MLNWQEFLDALFCSSCRKQNLELLDQWQECQGFTRTQAATITKLEKQNEQLKLLAPRPPPPELDYVVEKDSLWVQQRLESLGLNIIRLPLDAKYRITNKKNFMKILAWDVTDQLEYMRDFFDCPDFAMHLMVMTNLHFRINTAWVIDYKAGHSYNLVLFPDDSVFILEPQSDGLYLWTQRIEQFYYLKGSFVAI